MCRNHKTTNTLAYYRAQAENPSTQVAQPLDLTVWIRGTVNLTLPAPTQRQGGGHLKPSLPGCEKTPPVAVGVDDLTGDGDAAPSRSAVTRAPPPLHQRRGNGD